MREVPLYLPRTLQFLMSEVPLYHPRTLQFPLSEIPQYPPRTLQFLMSEVSEVPQYPPRLLALRKQSETAVCDLEKSVTSSESRRPVTVLGNKAEVLRACYRYEGSLRIPCYRSREQSSVTVPPKKLCPALTEMRIFDQSCEPQDWSNIATLRS